MQSMLLELFTVLCIFTWQVENVSIDDDVMNSTET